MGFKNPRRTARLIFDEGSPYQGAEVVCAFDVSLGMFFEFSQAGSEDMAAQREAFVRFGDELLIEWNLEEDDGTPIPATGEGILRISAPFVMVIISKWQEAIQDVPAPLGEPSPNGSTSEEPSNLTEAPSASPAS